MCKDTPNYTAMLQGKSPEYWENKLKELMADRKRLQELNKEPDKETAHIEADKLVLKWLPEILKKPYIEMIEHAWYS